jgi:hypothetical protein
LSRFEALRAAALTPLVGREEEIDLLLRRWRRAAEGEGQVVLICAEPGIGKSRLAAALRERLEGEDLTRLRYFSSPHHQDSALYPFISQLERAAGFEREDLVEAKLTNSKRCWRGPQRRRKMWRVSPSSSLYLPTRAICCRPRPRSADEKEPSRGCCGNSKRSRGKNRSSWSSRTCTGSIPARTSFWIA